jgi:hypothetical protein
MHCGYVLTREGVAALFTTRSYPLHLFLSSAVVAAAAAAAVSGFILSGHAADVGLLLPCRRRRNGAVHQGRRQEADNGADGGRQLSLSDCSPRPR